MIHIIASLLASIVSLPSVADWLIRRATRTPYTHLDGYMNRYWLFNAYEKHDGVEVTPVPWLPSARLHHILRKDLDAHMHDHPWDARTIILRGGYVERRLDSCGREVTAWRMAGDTAEIRYGQYHTIDWVPEEGVWTMFITFRYRGTWGFLVNGKKVPWREYLSVEKHRLPDDTQ